MNRNIRPLNKYERAYVKKMQRSYKDRALFGNRISLGKKLVLFLYGLKNKIKKSKNPLLSGSEVEKYLKKPVFVESKPDLQDPSSLIDSEYSEALEKDLLENIHHVLDDIGIESVNELSENSDDLDEPIDDKKQQIKEKSIVKKDISDIKRIQKKSSTRKIKEKKDFFQKIPLVGNYIKNTMSDKKSTKKRVLKKRRVVKKKPHKENKKKSKKRGFWFWIKWIIGFGIILGLIAAGFAFMWFSSLEIPDVDNFEKRKISNSTKLYDKTGEILLYDIHEDIRRTVVSGDQISKNAKNAIIAIEDHTFYEHDGVVWKSTFRALSQSLLTKLGISNSGFAGGSTLTQQMIKNTLLTRERTLTRKVKEWVLAYKIEKKLTKDQILTTYLNEAPYGGTIYGIQEASTVFFGKSALDLTIAESAYLASIPNLPTFYSPYGPNKTQLDNRKNTVLAEMKRYGYITDAEYREALQENVEFISRQESNAKALHFVQYVRAELEEKYGVDVVENEGLKVITTLDYKLQQKAEKIISDHVKDIRDQDATNASLVAVEAETGNIITMVGSRDYFDTDEFDGNFNVAISPRQPGSSFKPFAYAAAFEKGYLPETAIFDAPTQFNARCEADDMKTADGCYAPNNWDFKFKGALSFRNALAQSRNIPAIKVLYLAGISDVIRKAQEMGITSLTQRPSFYGLGLVLGGGEVSLLEMVSAYTTFANDGYYAEKNAILSVTDSQGVVLEEFEKDEKRVFSKNTARMVSDILSDNIARTPLYGSQSLIYFGNKSVAGKTGTTNDKRDAWMVGYTSDVAVGVWTGNNDNSPMKTGSKISMKPWREFMDEIIDEYDEDTFKSYDIPDDFTSLPNIVRGEWFGGETYVIDSVSGKLATEFTPDAVKIEVTNFDPHSILHSVNKNNPQQPGDSRSDSQYKNWEFGVQKYASENYAHMYSPGFVPPTEYDDVHLPDGTVTQGDFDFDIEMYNGIFDMDESVDVEIDFDGISKNDVQSALFYVNGNFIGSVESRPFEFNFVPQELQYLNGENTLRVVITNKDDEKVSREKVFEVDIPDYFVTEVQPVETTTE